MVWYPGDQKLLICRPDVWVSELNGSLCLVYTWSFFQNSKLIYDHLLYYV